MRCWDCAEPSVGLSQLASLRSSGETLPVDHAAPLAQPVGACLTRSLLLEAPPYACTELSVSVCKHVGIVDGGLCCVAMSMQICFGLLYRSG